jgi:hypothetical protein
VVMVLVVVVMPNAARAAEAAGIEAADKKGK